MEGVGTGVGYTTLPVPPSRDRDRDMKYNTNINKHTSFNLHQHPYSKQHASNNNNTNSAISTYNVNGNANGNNISNMNTLSNNNNHSNNNSLNKSSSTSLPYKSLFSWNSLLQWTVLFRLNRRGTLRLIFILLTGSSALIIGVLLYLLVKPWSRALYRRLLATYVSCMWLDSLTIMMPSSNIYITPDSDLPDGITSGMVVANHQHELDWWHMLMVLRFVGLHGNVKILVKDHLKQVPILGWILGFLEYPMVKADSWTKSRTGVTSTLRSFASDKFPTLLFFFPEGDKINEDIREKSRQYAEREKRPTLTNVLLPRTTGFNTCIEAFRDAKNPMIFDMTIAYPSLRDILSQNALKRNSNNNNAKDNLDLSTSNSSINNNISNVNKNNEVNGLDDTANKVKSNDIESKSISSNFDNNNSNSTNTINVTNDSFAVFISWLNGDKNIPHTKEVYIKLKKYSMEDVLKDPYWLDNRWFEKDRALSHFTRTGVLPLSNQSKLSLVTGTSSSASTSKGASSNAELREFNTRYFSIETSIPALFRLILMPLSIPILCFLSVPIMFTNIFMLAATRIFLTYHTQRGSSNESGFINEFIASNPNILGGQINKNIVNRNDKLGRNGMGNMSRTLTQQNGGNLGSSGSQSTTPYMPQTPFTSPFPLSNLFSTSSSHDESTVGFQKFGSVGNASQGSHFIPGPGPGPSGLRQYYASSNSAHNSGNISNKSDGNNNTPYMNSVPRRPEKELQYKETITTDINNSISSYINDINDTDSINRIVHQENDNMKYDKSNILGYSRTSTAINSTTTIPKTTIEEDDEEITPSPTAESTRK